MTLYEQGHAAITPITLRQRLQALLEQLAELRADAEVTQVELAERVGTSQSMLSKLERGVVRMDIMDVLDYLDGIGADPLSFFKKFLARIEWPKP